MYELSEKNKRISEMFSSIAPTYDFLNHFLSFNIDKLWRIKAVSLLDGNSVLDVATGTGDVALQINKMNKFKSITASDVSHGMLKIAIKKAEDMGADNIKFICAPAEALPFDDESFDNVIIAFGIRNIPDRISALYEFKRVLKKNGRLVVLEFNKPVSKVFNEVYNVYSNFVLPFLGRIISHNNKAYDYLPNSIKNFPDVEFLKKSMERAGFKEVCYFPLTFGISFIHTGIK